MSASSSSESSVSRRNETWWRVPWQTSGRVGLTCTSTRRLGALAVSSRQGRPARRDDRSSRLRRSPGAWTRRGFPVRNRTPRSRMQGTQESDGREHRPDHRDQGRRHRRSLRRQAAGDLHGLEHRGPRAGRHDADADRRGAAASGRRSRSRSRDGLDRRPLARHALRRHGGADLRPGRRRRRSAGSGTSSASRSTSRDRPRTASSGGRSTAIRPPSATSRRRSRPSRPGSRSST